MRALRQRMTDDMVVRRMSERTQEAYLAAVAALARYYRRSPDQITDDEIQAYLLHLIRDRKRAWSTCNIAVYGLRFFYHVTLKRDGTTFCIPAGRQPSTLPEILSRDEVQRILTATRTRKDRALLTTAYATGLRSNELVHLTLTDLDAARGMIRVEQGKGAKDRYTLCRRACWTSSAPSGRSIARACGSSHRGTASTRWTRRGLGRPTPRPSGGRVSTSAVASTPCGTRSRRICWKWASTW